MHRPLALFLLLFPTVHAQTSVVAPLQVESPAQVNPVYPTDAAERLDGFDRRRALESNSLVGNVPFRSVGPTVMSGRVADLEASPYDAATFYVAYASGGLWKTTSNGSAFTPLSTLKPV